MADAEEDDLEGVAVVGGQVLRAPEIVEELESTRTELRSDLASVGVTREILRSLDRLEHLSFLLGVTSAKAIQKITPEDIERFNRENEGA